MTSSIDQTLHLFANLLPNWTLIPILTLLPNFGGFHRTSQRVRLANRGRLLLRTPGPVPFGTCICSNFETILSWTCHVYGPFEFRTSLGTSILLCAFRAIRKQWFRPDLWLRHFTVTLYKITTKGQFIDLWTMRLFFRYDPVTSKQIIPFIANIRYLQFLLTVSKNV